MKSATSREERAMGADLRQCPLERQLGGLGDDNRARPQRERAGEQVSFVQFVACRLRGVKFQSLGLAFSEGETCT